MPEGGGIFAYLNLKAKNNAPFQSTKIEIISASLNEGEFDIDIQNGEFEILPPSFRVFSVRQLPNGIALSLSEAPDLDTLNLYDGRDSSIDAADLSLKNASGDRIALSAHWHENSNELYLLASTPLASGEYNLSIDSREDGLISASEGEWIDGNSDGTSGDPFFHSFLYTPSNHSISIGDTTRGASQELSLNGSRDGITGLPITVSTTASLTSIEGIVDFDPTQLHNASLSN